MTVVVTPRPPVTASSHTFTLPTVRELPPVARPGTFDATWCDRIAGFLESDPDRACDRVIVKFDG